MSFWYPSWDFYLETHDRILEEFGGYPGIAFGGELVFSSAIQAVQELPGGLYDKAGLMLQLLRTNRIVEDAQKRTIYTVTATFLRDQWRNNKYFRRTKSKCFYARRPFQ